MNKFLPSRVHMFIVGICSLFIMMLFTACQGFGVPGSGSITVTGQLQSVNAPAHSATLSINGQQVTVNGLTDQQVSLLQSQQGKTFTIQVTQTWTNTYTISAN